MTDKPTKHPKVQQQIKSEFIKNKERFAVKEKRIEETKEKIKINRFFKKFGRSI